MQVPLQKYKESPRQLQTIETHNPAVITVLRYGVAGVQERLFSSLVTTPPPQLSNLGRIDTDGLHKR
jgi:hypothetical protein